MRRTEMHCLAFTVCALLLVSPTIAMAQDLAGFPDVPKTHWAYEAVTELKQKGILIGYPPEMPVRKTAKDSKSRPVSPSRTHPHSNTHLKRHK